MLCVGKDSNLRSPKATDLQSVVIDHSTTDACIKNNTKIFFLHLLICIYSQRYIDFNFNKFIIDYELRPASADPLLGRRQVRRSAACSSRGGYAPPIGPRSHPSQKDSYVWWATPPTVRSWEMQYPIERPPEDIDGSSLIKNHARGILAYRLAPL